MSSGLYVHRTRNAGEIVTDTMYNTAHKNHLTNDVPNEAGALSDTLTDFRATQDPAPAGVPNLVASITEEFQQLRFALADIKTVLNQSALPYWYSVLGIAQGVQVGHGARVSRSITQAVLPFTTTAITFDTVSYDTGVVGPGLDPFFSVTHATRLTAQATGLYQLNGYAGFVSGPSGYIFVGILKNNATLLALSEWFKDAGVIAQNLLVGCQFELVQGDYVELVVYHELTVNPTTSNVSNAHLGLELLGTTVVVPPVPSHLVSITEAGNGSGIVQSNVGGIACPGTCSASFAEGSTVILTATSTAGAFSAWSGDVPVGHETDNPLTITVDAAKNITATFVIFSLMSSQLNATINTTTRYCPPTTDSTANAAAANAGVSFSKAVTIGNLYIHLSAALTGGQTVTAQFNINGSDDGGIVVSMSSGDQTKSATGTVSVSKDDLVCVKIVTNANLTVQEFSFRVTP